MYDDGLRRQSSMTYTKLFTALEAKHDVLRPPLVHGLFEQFMQFVDVITRESCRRAAEEGASRAYRLAVRNLPDDSCEGLYVPRSEIWVNTGGVGSVTLRSFRGQVDDPLDS